MSAKSSDQKEHQAVQPSPPQLKELTGPAAQAWSTFCRRLERAGQLILSKEGVEDPLLQAETLRFLTRELQAAMQWEIENADPDHPHFFYSDFSASGPPGPNLDNSYLWARVRGDAAYRVVIDTKEIFDLLIGITDEKWTNYGDFPLSQFEVGADGTLEILVGGERRGMNWLEMPPDGTLLAIRSYAFDWQRHALPYVYIERIGAEGQRPAPIDPETLARRLEATASWLETRPYQYPVFQERHMDRFPVNTLPPPVEIPGGGGPIKYGFGRFRLQDDEALIVEFECPNARYWTVHTYTVPWYSQIDVLNRITSLNAKQTHIDEDRKVRIVVAANDPGVQNWLDTGGLPTGSVFYRWIWSEDTPVPRTKVIPLAEVRAHLPPRTPAFDPAQRAEQLRLRRQHLARRLRY
ncbi:MAG: DUF1214 domain-containing protein [Steroidobacteraceae bacterium]